MDRAETKSFQMETQLLFLLPLSKTDVYHSHNNDPHKSFS